MIDTKINCRVENCYWNIGLNYDDNCACKEVKISFTARRIYIGKYEAEKRLAAVDKESKE